MKRIAVLVFLSLCACSWAGFVTKDWVLRGKSLDDINFAIESGALKLPEGVSVTLGMPNGCATLHVSGDVDAVDEALRFIADLDVEIRRFLVSVTIPLKHGSPFPFRPVPIVWAGKAKTFTLSDGNTQRKWEFRVCPVQLGGDSFAVRVTVGIDGADLRLVVPFVLGPMEDVSIGTGQDGHVEIIAVDSVTKTSRKARVSDELICFDGLKFQIRTAPIKEE